MQVYIMVGVRLHLDYHIMCTTDNSGHLAGSQWTRFTVICSFLLQCTCVTPPMDISKASSFNEHFLLRNILQLTAGFSWNTFVSLSRYNHWYLTSTLKQCNGSSCLYITVYVRTYEECYSDNCCIHNCHISTMTAASVRTHCKYMVLYFHMCQHCKHCCEHDFH